MTDLQQKDDAMRFDENPMHTGVTKDTASTPGYFRLLLPGLAGRYILRWGITASPDFAKDLGSIGVKPKITTEAAEIIGKAETIALYASQHIPAGNADKAQYFENTLAGEAVQALHTPLQKIGSDPRSMARAITGRAFFEANKNSNVNYELGLLHKENWEDWTKELNRKSTSNITMRGYDNALGVGSLFLTGYYANRVASDMKKVFAETVAYEFDKDPKDVTYRDLWASKNKLVEDARSNYIGKNLGRVGTDVVFFIGNLAHLPKMGWLNKYSFSDLGVGLKGAQLIGEVINKHTTVFEDLVQLIDNKMNPLKGLGAPISVADTFDLYQKYTQSHDANATFRDAVSGQNNDGRDWTKAQAIFKRVTELMNLTYKYKHIGRQPSETEQAKADFALPKFLYLLGNGMIDTFKPEETLAYVEVANAYGIPAVKQLQRALARGIPVDEALVNYPGDVRQSVTDLRSGVEKQDTQKVKEQDNAPRIPQTQVHSIAEMARLIQSPAYQMSAR